MIFVDSYIFMNLVYVEDESLFADDDGVDF